MTTTIEDLARARTACRAARWPELHRDDCAWCAHVAGRHLTSIAYDTEAPSPLVTVAYTIWASHRVQDFAARCHDENELIVAQECGLLLGHPVDVTDLCDLADALEDVRNAESPTEAALRQPSVDEITLRIVDGRSCAVTL